MIQRIAEEVKLPDFDMKKEEKLSPKIPTSSEKGNCIEYNILKGNHPSIFTEIEIYMLRHLLTNEILQVHLHLLLK